MFSLKTQISEFKMQFQDILMISHEVTNEFDGTAS